MDEYALRDDDGNIHPTQVAYVDGYSFADTLLEGVLFKVEVMRLGVGTHLVCNGAPGFEKYMLKFNNTQKADWCRQAVAELFERDGHGVSEDGQTTLHWGTD